MRKLLLHIILCLVFISCTPWGEYCLNYDIPLKNLIDSLEIKQNNLQILIDKSEYKLSILSDMITIKEYPVVFGSNPTDDKLMEGDQCTPEGTFNLVSKYPHKNWEKFIWISYPTDESWIKHKKAKGNGTIPKNANIGGEIGIHGVPYNMNILIDIKYNWTLGCISLKNKDVNEIYPYINEKTKIEIRK